MEASSGDLRVEIDPDVCAASAVCTGIAPQIFELGLEAETATVRLATVSDPELQDLARQAEAGCPTGAIKLTG